MDDLWKTALWNQFGASIDMLENALVACPDSLWKGRLWNHAEGPEFAEFWFLTFHTLFWLDLYLSGVQEEELALPAFTQAKTSAEWEPPKQPYPKEELRAYLASLRQKCHDTLVALTDEQARRPIEYPWIDEKAVSFLELQMYNLRHVHEHAAQLSLFLGQHGIPDEALDWVVRAKAAEMEGDAR
jgi:uncharacterized damage-inducible protein DinB